MGEICLEIMIQRCTELDQILIDSGAITSAPVPTAEEFKQLFEKEEALDGEMVANDMQINYIHSIVLGGGDSVEADDIDPDTLKQRATELEQLNKDLKQQKLEVAAKLAQTKGYFLHRFNEFLLSIKVTRKAHFGHRLVGSEVRDLLREENIDKLTDLLRSHTIVTIDNNPTVLGDNRTADKLKIFMMKLSTLWTLCTAARRLTEEEISTIETTCKELNDHYTSAWSNRSITPKLHNLIYHFPAIAKQYKTIGLLREHSIESIHTRFKQYYRRYVNIINPVKLLLYSIRLHMLTCDARIEGNCEAKSLSH
jgi:hypothetical protein